MDFLTKFLEIITNRPPIRFKFFAGFVCLLGCLNATVFASVEKLSLSSLFTPHSKSKLKTGSVSYTFSGPSDGHINYIQLCTGSSGCTSCNTNVLPITSGTPISYSAAGTTYSISPASLVAYLQQKSLPQNTYYIGLYAQSQELNTSASYYSTSSDTTAPGLCIQTTYDGTSATLAQIGGNLAPLNSSTTPVVLAAGGQYFNNFPLFNISSTPPVSVNIPVTGSGIQIHSTACSGSFCIASGVDTSANSGDGASLLYYSQDSGATWSSTSLSADGGELNSTSAASVGSTTYFTAAGFSSGSGSNQPLLYTGTYTSSVGWSWTDSSPILTTGYSGQINGTSCIGGASLFCTVAGQYLDTGGNIYPLLYTGTYSGSSWSFTPQAINAGGSNHQGLFNATSCSGGGNAPFCTAVGLDITTLSTMLFLYPNSTWRQIISINDTASLYGTACVGGASTPTNQLCIAVGGINSSDESVFSTTTSPKLYYGTNTSDTFVWSSNSAVSTANGFFTSIACSRQSTVSGSSTPFVCAAGGQYNTSELPLLDVGSVNPILSTATWSEATTTANKAIFNGASCLKATGVSATCTVAGQDKATQRPLVYQTTYSTDTTSWNSPNAIYVTNDSGSFNTVTCASDSLCLSGGVLNEVPLLSTSTNGGVDWPLISAPAINSGTILSTSCSSNSPSAICAAAGKDQTLNMPILYSSSNGTTWTSPTLTNPLDLQSSTNNILNGTSCTASGAQGVCAAAGQYSTGTYTKPLLYTSQDGGSTWSNITTAITSSYDGSFLSTSCSGSDANAICITGGKQYPDGTATYSPLLFMSTNGGTSWAPQSTSGITATSYFNSTSCTGSGYSTVCVASGADQSIAGQPPLLYVGSYNNSLTWSWSVPTVTPSLPTNANFYAVKCTGNGANAICIAGGRVNGSSPIPLLYVSHDGGNNWSSSGINYMSPSNGFFNAVNCTAGTPTTICTAAGQLNDNQPALYVGQYDANTLSWTWSSANLLAAANHGNLQGTSCIGSGLSTICTASGQDFTIKLPSLFVLTNLTSPTPTITPLSVTNNEGQFWSAAP